MKKTAINVFSVKSSYYINGAEFIQLCKGDTNSKQQMK